MIVSLTAVHMSSVYSKKSVFILLLLVRHKRVSGGFVMSIYFSKTLEDSKPEIGHKKKNTKTNNGRENTTQKN